MMNIFIILLLLATSCTSSTPYKAYPGETLSSSEITTLNNTIRYSPTSDDQIKIYEIDQQKMPSFQSAFEIMPGIHNLYVCYSESYKEKGMFDSWFGKYCSIHGTFNLGFDFIKGHTYELRIKPTNKSFAYQNIKVSLINKTLKTQREIEIYNPSLSLDCMNEEPNLLSYFVSKCD